MGLTSKLITISSAMLAVSQFANAQTIIDTIGTGDQWGIGGQRSNAAPIGYDPVTDPNFPNILAPAFAANAGYAVLPFTVSSLPGGAANLSEVDIIFNAQPPTLGTASNVTDLRGAIFQTTPTAMSFYGAGVSQVGSFFSFNTSPLVNSTISTTLGSGLSEIITTTDANPGGVSLSAGKTYWLVIAPKAGLSAKDGDALITFGLWNYGTSATVTGSGGSLSTAYAAVLQAQAETNGANNNGVGLKPVVLGRAKSPAYFAAKVVVAPAPGATVNGTIVLDSVSDLSNIAIPVDPITFRFRDPNTGADLFTKTASISSTGAYTIPGVTPGTYKISIKGDKQLGVTLPNNVTVSGTTTLPTVTLLDGNADGNDVINFDDFLTLLNAFGSKLSDPTSGYDPTADFNYDGQVNFDDFLALLNNFGVVSDP